MPVITDISQQIKNKDIYSIFIDGKFALSLSSAQLAEHSLKTDQNISTQQLKKLRELYAGSKCYNSALRYLAISPRSTSQLSDFLMRKGYIEDQINSAIAKLTSNGYLNDNDFARLWVQNRMRLNPKSSMELRAELTKKGLPKDIIDSTLADLDEDDQLLALNRVIERKSRQSAYQDKQKLLRYLAQKGYSYSLVKKALDSTDFYQE